LLRGTEGQVSETPKPGDPRLERSVAVVIGGRTQAMRGAADEAGRCGYTVVIVDEPVVGEARDAAQQYFQRLTRHVGEANGPVAIVSSGETTVRVLGRGRGGRNQEFALALVDALATLDADAVVASVGTDGVDGPTDAAGAMVDTTTAGRARRLELPAAQSYLADNNAYAFFSAVGDLIRTGPTGTNVGDVQIALIDKRAYRSSES
jgi:hydroxypyruvate reductase